MNKKAKIYGNSGSSNKIAIINNSARVQCTHKPEVKVKIEVVKFTEIEFVTTAEHEITHWSGFCFRWILADINAAA